MTDVNKDENITRFDFTLPEPLFSFVVPSKNKIDTQNRLLCLLDSFTFYRTKNVERIMIMASV